CLLAGLGFAAGARADPTGLAVSPREVVFTDAYDGRQLLVSLAEHDLTRAARYSSSDAAVVRIDDRGYLRPTGDGAAQVMVRHGSAEARVTVRGTRPKQRAIKLALCPCWARRTMS